MRIARCRSSSHGQSADPADLFSHIDAFLHSDLQGEVSRLKRKNSYLQSGYKIQSGFFNQASGALRRQRRAKYKEDNYVRGING